MRIKKPNRPRKIKDKKSSGCAMCKPHKHGWTSGRIHGKPTVIDPEEIIREVRRGKELDL